MSASWATPSLPRGKGGVTGVDIVAIGEARKWCAQPNCALVGKVVEIRPYQEPTVRRTVDVKYYMFVCPSYNSVTVRMQ